MRRAIVKIVNPEYSKSNYKFLYYILNQKCKDIMLYYLL